VLDECLKDSTRRQMGMHHDHVAADDVGPHAVQVDQDPAVRLGAGAVAAGPEEVHRQALRHRLYAPRQVCVPHAGLASGRLGVASTADAMLRTFWTLMAVLQRGGEEYSALSLVAV